MISAENIKPTAETSGSASDTTILNLDKDGRSVNLVIFDYRTAPEVTLRSSADHFAAAWWKQTPKLVT
jgi:hypothetical protein